MENYEAEAEVEYEMQREDTTQILSSSEDEDEDEDMELFGDYSPTDQIPFAVMKQIKTKMLVQLEKGKKRKVTAFIDPGAPGSFCGRELIDKLGPNVKVEEVTEEFWGGIEGKPLGKVRIKIAPSGAANLQEYDMFVMENWDEKKKEAYGDMIIGLATAAAMELTMEMGEKEHILNFRKFGVKHRIAVEKDTTIGVIGAINPKPNEEDHLKTVYPTEEQWKKKVAHMPEPWRSRALEIVKKYPKRFFVSGYLPPVKGVEYGFKYTGKPFRHTPIPMPREDRKYVMDAMREQLKYGVVGEITEDTHKLEYVSATFLKPEIGKARICINYTDMNAGTEKVDFPLPNKEDLIAKFAGGDYYISMDAKAAYNQVPVAEECQKYMVFVVLDEDNNPRYFYPKRANFGSMNMPGYFQRLSGDLFNAKRRAVYIDDLNIKGLNGKEEEALQSMDETLQIAEENNITFAFKKTHIWTPEYQFLGEIMDRRGHRPNPDRVRALRNFPMPKRRRDLRGFLGLYNFLAPLKRHATTKPILELQHLTSEGVKFDRRLIPVPFEEVKKTLCKWLLLFPFNPDNITYVMTDSSDFGQGGVLLQEYNGRLRAFAVHSKRWPDWKKPIPPHIKEGMALVNTLKRFEYMLRQTKLLILTDSQNTRDLLTTAKVSPTPARWIRWRAYIQATFRAQILHISQRLNLAADAFSRQVVRIDDEKKPVGAIQTDQLDDDDEERLRETDADDWTADEVFRAPIMRMIYDEQQRDPEVQELKKKAQQTAVAGDPKKLPQAVYVLHHGVVYRKDARYGMQAVVPKSLVDKILFLEHDTELKAHPGASSMKSAVRRHYHWSGMDTDIDDYVASCIGCQLSKAKMSSRFASSAHRRVSNIFSTFSMDLIDMTTISKVYRYVLVLQDYYSSFVVLTNLTNKKAPTILHAFWDTMSIFGPPQSLVTDNGAEFVNSLVEELTTSEGIKHVLTYAYHAEGNAKNERTHMSIRQALRIFAAEHPENWHRYTKKLQYAINTRESPPLRISPYERLFAMTPRALHNTTPFLDYNHSEMLNARRDLNLALREFQKHQQAAAEQPPPPVISVGDKVLLVQPFPKHSKALHPAHGPYTIVQLIGQTGAMVRHDATKKERRVPRKWIRLFITRKGGRNAEMPEQKATESLEVEEREEETEQEVADMQIEQTKEVEAAQKEAEEQIDDEKPSANEQKKRKQVSDSEQPQKKVRRALERLKPYNEPVIKSTRLREPKTGNMVIVKQGATARVAEVVKEKMESLQVHWYGTTTNREHSRRRWKWYPGWENDKNEIEYKKTQLGTGKPALCEIPKSEVIVAFEKLTLHSALPTDIVSATNRFTLG